MRERPIVLSGSAHRDLAQRIARALGVELTEVQLGSFPDGELHVAARVEMARRHVVIVQPTSAPSEKHLLELCLLADACRRAGAGEITAVIPYFAYARQDRRRHEGDPIGVRVVASILGASSIDRVVGLDAHGGAVEAVCTVPFVHLTAFEPLVASIGGRGRDDLVVVSPDLGAVKLAQRFGDALNAPVAIVHKHRRSGLDVEALGVIGEVRDRAPLIVDDMISTGGTIEAAARTVLEAGCKKQITILASHGLFVGPAEERLAALPIARVVVTDSVPPRKLAFPVEHASIAALLGRAIDAIHSGAPLEPMLSHA